MNCPRCNTEVPDGSGSCPSCGYDLAPSGEFIFCEGCGARLMTGERTCPKCGRPAPGILSAKSASADLAAGKTASFPRLTPGMMGDTGAVRSAPELVSSSLDPQVTGVLDADALAAAEADAGARERSSRRGRRPQAEPAASESAGVPLSEDAYRRRRRWPLVAAALLVVALGVGGWFVAADPLGVMPGFYRSFSEAAGDMFPSRQLPEANAAQQDGSTDAADDASETPVSDETLSDDQAYQQLSAAWTDIVAQHDALSDIIADYNSGFMASSLDTRTSCSKSAYAARDALDAVIARLQDMKLAEDSAYAEDVTRLTQLAQWVRTRVDIYCASWDISLSYTGSERPSAHESEILAPLRERASEDDQARENYFANVEAWKPQQE